jgi:GTP cyclohydrolase I
MTAKPDRVAKLTAVTSPKPRAWAENGRPPRPADVAERAFRSLQERLTSQIAERLVDELDPRGVVVVIEAEHLCMTMRGVQKPVSYTRTSVVRGIFREKAEARAEALELLRAA